MSVSLVQHEQGCNRPARVPMTTVISLTLRRNLMWLKHLPLGWHERNHSGETIQRMGKATSALFGFSQHQFIYLQNLISVLGPSGC